MGPLCSHKMEDFYSPTNQVLGQLARGVGYREKVTFLQLYNVIYIRQHLQYAVASWSPWTKADRECLEKGQRCGDQPYGEIIRGATTIHRNTAHSSNSPSSPQQCSPLLSPAMQPATAITRYSSRPHCFEPSLASNTPHRVSRTALSAWRPPPCPLAAYYSPGGTYTPAYILGTLPWSG